MTKIAKHRGREVNLVEFAELRGVAVNTILAMVKRGAPVVRRGRGGGKGAGSWQFNSAAMFEWELADALETITGSGDTAPARERYWTARARREELDVRDLEGALVPKTDYGLFVESLIIGVRSRLMSLPRKMALVVAPPERVRDAEAKLEAECRSILEDIASSETADEVLDGHERGSESGGKATMADVATTTDAHS